MVMRVYIKVAGSIKDPTLPGSAPFPVTPGSNLDPVDHLSFSIRERGPS